MKHLAPLLLLLLVSACLDARDICIDECPRDVNLICGNDDRSYLNPCEASCADVEIQYSGACTDEDDVVDQT